MKTPIYIEVHKGVDEVSSYQGLIDSEVLAAVLEGTCEDEFVRLERVQWTEEVWDSERNQTVTNLVRLGSTPPHDYFTGEIWLRPHQISMIKALWKLPEELADAPGPQREQAESDVGDEAGSEG